MIEVRRFEGEDDVIYVRKGEALYEVTFNGLSVVMPEEDGDAVWLEDVQAYRTAILEDTDEVSLDNCDPRLVYWVEHFLTTED